MAQAAKSVPSSDKMRSLFPVSRLISIIAAGVVLAACTSAPEHAQPAVPASLPTAAQAPASTTVAPAVTPNAETGPAAVVPAATSRGPNLEATDPLSVKLDSGELQLVEFFRFT